jgi:hypothetical protein
LKIVAQTKHFVFEKRYLFSPVLIIEAKISSMRFRRALIFSSFRGRRTDPKTEAPAKAFGSELKEAAARFGRDSNYSIFRAIIISNHFSFLLRIRL